MIYSDIFYKELEKENSDENVQSFLHKHQQTILPFYKSNGFSEQFNGVDEVIISCRTFHTKNAVAKIILVTGYNESYLKYSEFIMNLCEMGFSVYCYDHRGQGFSGRFPNQNKRGYVDNFENYVDDLCYFFENVVGNHENHLPVFIIAHSMGGAVTSIAVGEQKINPTGVILCSPMHEIALTPYHILEYPIYLLSSFLSNVGFEKKYAFGQTDCIPYRPFETNDVTHSKARYNIWRKFIAEIDDMQIGGPTFGWIKNSIYASRKARKLGMANNKPILLLQAEEDTVVHNSAHDIFIQHFACSEKVVLGHARHEILMEVDFIRNKAIEYIKNFIFSKLS